MKPKRNGRPPHEPTAELRRAVEQHAAVGTTHEHIAKLLKLSVPTLKKHYADELELGLARANAVVASVIFTEATGGNMTAAIFWMKTRAQWRETTKVVHGGAPDEPIEFKDVTHDADEFTRRITSLASRGAEAEGTGEPEAGGEG